MKDSYPAQAPRRQEPRGGAGQRGEPTSLRFGSVARVLARLAETEGLSYPAFRSPPGLGGVTRSIRRRPDGKATVAVALRGRPWAAVLADMVEGVVAANGLRGVAADRCRTALWAGLSDVGEIAGPAGGSSGMSAVPARAEPTVSNRLKCEKARGFAA